MFVKGNSVELVVHVYKVTHFKRINYQRLRYSCF